jgi:hypothetical protein
MIVVALLILLAWNYLIALIIRWGVVMSFGHDPGITGLLLITTGLGLLIASWFVASKD